MGLKVVGIEGLPEVKRALKQVESEVRKAAERAVSDEADAVREDMRATVRATAYDTGELHDSIDDEAQGLQAWIRARARHANFVEHGTTRMPARPYAQPAFLVAERRMPKRVGEAVKGAIE
ncbi:MAG: HK97-gp10 family putative phage morphogenesis protein [Solirubrobacterales bacterium]|nr:HK97-gp10 family putative phage morphogenesis protein [Solirubrobacterales bacterium]